MLSREGYRDFSQLYVMLNLPGRQAGLIQHPI